MMCADAQIYDAAERKDRARVRELVGKNPKALNDAAFVSKCVCDDPCTTLLSFRTMAPLR